MFSLVFQLPIVINSTISGRQNSKKLSSAGAGVSGGKTSFNRFSPFVKSGGENYVLGKLNANVQAEDVIQVVVRIVLLLFSKKFLRFHSYKSQITVKVVGAKVFISSVNSVKYNWVPLSSFT